jgi:hypothetical protein
MIRRRRGRRREPQVFNARDGFADLTPVSEAPAEQTRANWAATLPDTDDVPLIWERNPR